MHFSEQERNNRNQNDDDNPWNSNLFHDMQLDEVCSNPYVSEKKINNEIRNAEIYVGMCLCWLG